MLSPPFLMMMFYGGFDWLPLSGLLLPPMWGFLLLSVKPQVCIFSLVDLVSTGAQLA